MSYRPSPGRFAPSCAWVSLSPVQMISLTSTVMTRAGGLPSEDRREVQQVCPVRTTARSSNEVTLPILVPLCLDPGRWDRANDNMPSMS